jgi:SNF2 family DNA or RNA helicase
MALLLSPHRLLLDHLIIESLHVNKSPKGIDFIVKELDSSELRKYYQELAKEARDVLIWFNKEGMIYAKGEIKKTFDLQRGGTPYEVYSRNAITRKLHELLLRIKPFASQTKWYHKTKGEKGNFKTAPCVFSEFKPRLEFEVKKDNDKYQLITLISMNGSSYSLKEFTRHQFLLESKNEYFLLSYKDYQTLEWLRENDNGQYSNNPQELAIQLLAPLEKEYKVNRNNLFTATEIMVEPTNRVMLSEISNSFLVLTPQWVYEGFLAEGSWKEKTEIVQDGGVYILNRHKEKETAFVQILESLHTNFSKQLNGYYYLSFGDAQKKQWFLKVYHRFLEMDIEVVGMDMLNHFRYSPHKPEMTVVIKEPNDQSNMVTLQISFSFGDEKISLTALRKILLAGQRLIFLKDGSLGILPEEWLVRYASIIKHGIVSGNEIKVARWMALQEDQATDDTEVMKPLLKKDWWKKWLQWQQSDEILYPVPEMIRATLRPYQHKGYEWMLLLAEAGAGACLADDMGLGKTLQTICLLASRSAQFPEQRHLIVCPSSLIYNWLQELQKFAPHLKTVVYHGAQRSFEDVSTGDHQVIITSYGTMRSDIEKISTLLFSVAVIDESHNIKNPSSLITIAVNQLNAAMRVALSGTPVMNNTFDLYAQLGFLLPGMFGSREFFKNEYANAIDRDRDPDKIKALQKLTAPFLLRRTKEQVAKDLPEKMESILWCEMRSDQKFAYESVKENVRNSILLEIKDKGLSAGKLSVLNGIIKLRQICNSCELVSDQDIFTTDSIKTEILLAELKNIIGQHKALVFSQFTKMLDLLERDLLKNNIPLCRLDGSTPVNRRQEIVNNFQQAGSVEKVFLISLKAGNAGLNLTAADYVFIIDPWWNTAVQQQAIDRTHRIGQTKNVFAYKMICKGTIEEKIIQLQQHKKQLAEELVAEDEGFVKALTEEDVEFLFN